jgi:ribosome recycling factor
VSDDELTGVVMADTREHMDKAVSHTRAEFGGVRSGRATAGLVEHLRVETYGSEVELRTIAGLSVPEARLLVISPYDKTTLTAIEKAIQASDLGITPSNDGNVIRLTFPPLTEERRKELVKVVRHKAEEGRVAIRNVRRTARHDLEALEKDGDISSDSLERAEKELEKLTQEHVTAVDQLLAHKEQELLEI